MVLDDFNEIFFQFEKVRGNQRSESLMSNFRQTLEDCDLFNLGHQGKFFTWSNRHVSSSFTKERLDHVVANPKWSKMYNATKVESTISRCFDHRPILATCGCLGNPKRERPFRYEASWDLHEECNPQVAQLWRQLGAPTRYLEKVQHLLSICQKGVKKWSSSIHKGRTTEINTKLAKLKEL